MAFSITAAKVAIAAKDANLTTARAAAPSQRLAREVIGRGRLSKGFLCCGQPILVVAAK